VKRKGSGAACGLFAGAAGVEEQCLLGVMRIHKQGLAAGRQPIFHVMRHRRLQSHRHRGNYSRRCTAAENILLSLILIAREEQQVGCVSVGVFRC